MLKICVPKIFFQILSSFSYHKEAILLKIFFWVFTLEKYHYFRKNYQKVLKNTKATMMLYKNRSSLAFQLMPLTETLLENEILRYYFPKYHKCRTVILQNVDR